MIRKITFTLKSLALGLLLTTTLSSCGFHLKGLEPLDDAYRRMALVTFEFGAFESVLVRDLSIKNIDLILVETDPETGLQLGEELFPYALIIAEDISSSRELTSRQLALRKEIRYLINDEKGKPVLPVRTISAELTVNFDPTETESEDIAREDGFRTLHLQLSDQIYRQIKAL